MKENLNASKKLQKTLKLEGNSLGCLSVESSFRQCCASIVGFWYFEAFIIALIIISTILLTFENPLIDPKGPEAKFLEKADIVMTSLFTLEMILKIIVKGFICNGSKSYLLDSWC